MVHRSTGTQDRSFRSAEYNDTARYTEALAEVITTSRESAPKSAFYVALTSWCPGEGNINISIREAQTSVLRPGDRVFQDPDLDAIAGWKVVTTNATSLRSGFINSSRAGLTFLIRAITQFRSVRLSELMS